MPSRRWCWPLLGLLALLVVGRQGWADITTNLQLYYKLDEVSGGSATDSSGNGRTGAIAGSAVFSAGRVNNGLTCDGIDDYISVVAAGLDITSGYTMTAWFKLNASCAGGCAIVWWGAEVSGQRRGMQVFGSPAKLYASTNGFNVAGVTSLTTGVWYHGAITVTSGGAATIYVNGVQDSTGTLTLNAYTYTSTEVCRNQASGELMNGMVDEVKIFSRVLSAGDIAEDALLGGRRRRLVY